MGGPWRDRSFDARSWHPPAPRLVTDAEPAASRPAHDYLTAVAVSYVAAVLTSVAIVLGFLKYGW